MSGDVELIVLASTKVGESSVVIHSLSREYGRRGFLMHVGKRPAGALLLPLNILEARISENPKSTLWTASRVSSRHPLAGIRGDIRKNTMTQFLSELLFRSVREGESSDELYEWCRDSILALDALEGDFSNFHIRFLLELCVQLGFSPGPEDLAPFAGGNLGVMQRFLESDTAASMLIPLDGKRRTDICRSLIRYLEHHSEMRINVRSLDVLRELYS